MLLDTPGIDDPNPKAREMCLNLVKNEADLLLVMSRPKDTPSPVQSFQDFISSVKEFGKSVSVQDMLLYLLNEDKRISDSKLSLNKHRIELENEPYCIPNEKIIDVDASDEKSIGLCLEKVNEYLSVNLPIRDKRILEYVNQELKIINGKTIEFLNLNRFDIPTDLDAITANRFDDWFSECWKKFNYKTKELIYFEFSYVGSSDSFNCLPKIWGGYSHVDKRSYHSVVCRICRIFDQFYCGKNAF